MIRQHYPATRVVILGGGSPGEDGCASRVGASAFLLRPKTVEQIISTLCQVCEMP
jgi:hypothetical protein